MQGIILIGFMGAGKTSIGRVLAKKTGIKHIDLDEKIVEEIGMSIDQYFDLYGQGAFREKETEVLRKYLGNRLIISTGGGIILKAENRDLLKEMERVVYLKTSPQVFLSRIKEDTSTIRPLTISKPPEEIIEIFQERISLYEESANMVVGTDGARPEEIANEILYSLEEKK